MHIIKAATGWLRKGDALFVLAIVDISEIVQPKTNQNIKSQLAQKKTIFKFIMLMSTTQRTARKKGRKGKGREGKAQKGKYIMYTIC